MRYILDRGHPLQLPCGGRGLSWGLGLVFAVASKYLISSSRPWVFGNPFGITKECGGWEVGLMAFHPLSFQWPALGGVDQDSKLPEFPFYLRYDTKV